MISIKNTSGSTILSVDINEGSIYHHSLMDNEYVRLNFTTAIGRYISFTAGTYIEYKGEKYTLIEPYTPERKDESEIYYELTFHSPRQMWKKMILFYEQDGVKETDFNTTDYIYNIGVIIVNNLLWATGVQYTFMYDSTLVGTNSFSFREVSIFDALTQLANAWDTEWWVDGTNIHLSKCSFGSQITLKVCDNISPALITKPNDGYFTRFYIFGSTRNIDQDDSSSTTVTTLLNRRLRLPEATYPGSYIDIRSNLSQSEIFSTVLYFDDIYPSSPYSIKNAGVGMVGEDDNTGLVGIPQWWFTLNEVTTFDTSLIIAGKTLSVNFTSGALLGWEFELSFNLINDVPEEHDGHTKFFITPDVSTGLTVPGLAILNPGIGDNIILFNLIMPDDYVVDARKRLEVAALAEVENRKLNMNEYRFDSNPVLFNNNNIDLNVGRSVLYKDDIVELSTRVLTVEKQLDYEIHQSITIGEKKITSSNQELRSEVNTIVENVNNFIDFKNLSANIDNAINLATQQAIQKIVSMGSLWVAVPTIQNIQYLHTTHKVVIDGDLLVKGNILSQKEVTAWYDNGSGDNGNAGLIQKVYSYSDLGGVFSNAVLTDTFNAYTTNELYKRIVLLESGSGISGDFVRSVTKNNYPGLAHPDGTDSQYFRTTSSGIIPYNSGGASYCGTSGWPFLYIYGVNVNGTTLSITGTSALTGNVTTKNHVFVGGGIYTNGKSTGADGIAGTGINNGYLSLVGNAYPQINFYYNKATTITTNVIEYASGRLGITGSLHVGGTSNTTAALYVSGTSVLNGTTYANVITPNIGSTYNLGDSSTRWLNGYFVNLNASGAMTISGLLTVGSLLVTGKSIFSGAIYCKDYIFTGSKTSTDDGLTGNIVGVGNLWLCASGSVGIHFYGSSSTSVTNQLIDYSGQIRVSNKFQVGSLASLTSVYTFYVNGTGYISSNVSIGGYANSSYMLACESFICNNWVRTVGNTGWYNQTYGGGIYMTDTTYVRIHNDKRFYVSNTLSPTGTGYGSAAISTAGGINCYGNIYAGGNIVSYGEVTSWSTSSSDIRLKKNIRGFNAIEIIYKLDYFSFDWNKKALSINSCFKNDYKHYGTSAQDVEKILPGFVSKINGYKIVSYERFIPIIMQGIKELKRENEKLKEELKLLKDGITG